MSNVRRNVEQLEVSKEGVQCFLERLDNLLELNRIGVKDAVSLVSELTTNQCEPENELDDMIFGWQDRTKEKFENSNNKVVDIKGRLIL